MPISGADYFKIKRPLCQNNDITNLFRVGLALESNLSFKNPSTNSNIISIAKNLKLMYVCEINGALRRSFIKN